MERAIQQTTRAVLAKPDAERVIAWVGGADLRSGGATVVLKDKRKLTTDEFKELIRPDLRNVPDVRVTTGQSWGSTAIPSCATTTSATTRASSGWCRRGTPRSRRSCAGSPRRPRSPSACR